MFNDQCSGIRVYLLSIDYCLLIIGYFSISPYLPLNGMIKTGKPQIKRVIYVLCTGFGTHLEIKNMHNNIYLAKTD
jgi:hypothetical protein